MGVAYESAQEGHVSCVEGWVYSWHALAHLLWSDSPDYEQPVRASHAVSAILLVILILDGWAWVSADHTSSACADHSVAPTR